ncbi:MAG: phosphatase PAP2 family protein [Bdellovibrionales bacterium]|nr:phosphatase PAP2 family protein [Bdellovibrionales bacterium]
MKKMIALTWGLISFSAFGASTGWESTPWTDFVMADFPAAGSVEEKRDFDELYHWQKTRTSAECAEAKAQGTPHFQQLFSALFTAKEVSRVEYLVGRAMKLGDNLAGDFKDHFQRPRPYQANSGIRPCINMPKGARAYPSGHATIGSVGSCILKEIFPTRAAEIETAGRRVGDLRVIGGVHHPSDIQAGWQLGQDICKTILADPDFQKELKAL